MAKGLSAHKFVNARQDVKAPTVTIKSRTTGTRKVKLNCACNGMKDARASRPDSSIR